jgi:DNA helicase-2/ATP-dependent DNA helicase PcrA
MVSGEIDFIEKDEKKNDFVKEKIMVTTTAIELVKEQIRDSYIKIKNLEFTEGCGEADCHWCNFVRDNKINLPLALSN